VERSRKRILVAEDNIALATVIRFNLEKSGFEVCVAPNGSEAVELLGKQQFDMLITDYQMPSLGGEEFCRHIRESMQLMDLPIVMCSAKGYELDSEYLRSRWNVQKVIFKPFSLREIVQIVRSTTSQAILPKA